MASGVLLKDLLSQKRDNILQQWLHLILETYPPETSAFLKKEKDQFTNPIGYTIAREVKVLYNELLHKTNPAKLSFSLNNIIRIRSVQDFSPSQAISFVFFLKKLIREELKGEIWGKKMMEDLLKFESKIDKMALLAFDIYMKCREEIYRIKVNEMKAEREMVFRMLERANLLYRKLEKE